MNTPRRASATISKIASADKLAALEPIFTEAFGRRARPLGWFRRKLSREVVDPKLSLVACDPEGAVLGFILVGAPRSQAGVARIVSTGVLPRSRNAGLGRRLLEAAAQTAAQAGLERLVALAEPDRIGHYAGADFSPREMLTTLLASAPRPEPTARPDRSQVHTGRRSEPGPWDMDGAQSVGGWLAEAWERTPRDACTTIVFGGAKPRAWAHVSTEGEARLIHRLLLASPPAAGLVDETCRIAEALRSSLTPHGPLFFYGLPSVSPITDALREAGWMNAQSCTRMVRSLRGAGVDRARPPASSWLRP